MFILWASQKGYEGNQPLFWAKNECGYTTILENCEIYKTYEQAASSAYRNCDRAVIPIPFNKIKQHTRTIPVECDLTLEEARKEWDEYINR